MGWELAALIAACYALGCLNAGYYVVRWRTGADIRTVGTGTAGARNAGRHLGKAGFAATLLLDLSKGALAVAVSRWIDAGTGGEVAAMLAVVSGHIWPAQLGFRGGKGLATATGAMLVFDPLLVGVAATLAAVLVALTRRFTVPGLIAITAVPLIGILFGRSGAHLVGLVAVAGTVLFAHRANIARQWSLVRTRQTAPDALSSVPVEGQSVEQQRPDIQDRN